MNRSSLRKRLLLGLLGYVALLSLLVTAHGAFVNEHAERTVWQTLLDAELDRLQERRRLDPSYRPPDSDRVSLYDTARDRRIPEALLRLQPGLHDDVEVQGRERVILVRASGPGRLILTMDITQLERAEAALGWMMTGAAGLLALLLGLFSAWGVSRLVNPLSSMAQQIAGLRPDRFGQRIELSPTAGSELEIIAGALNDHLRKTDRFVERERAFVDIASHELRTPIAVIAGAADLALQPEGLPTASRVQLGRIRRVTRDIEQLIALLLVLAKDPARLARASDRISLDRLLPEIVDDHRHLTRDKDLTLAVAGLERCEILAPLPIVQAAIGNLLRNAIENSDRGTIAVRLEKPATVVIEDPGHGMSPEEVSAIYSRIARGGGDRLGGGIGLELISRLCEHLGWGLDFRSAHGQGTITTLQFTPLDENEQRNCPRQDARTPA